MENSDSAIWGVIILLGCAFVFGWWIGHKIGAIDTVKSLKSLKLGELRNELKRREMYDVEDIYAEIERKEEIERQREIEQELRRQEESLRQEEILRRQEEEMRRREQNRD